MGLRDRAILRLLAVLEIGTRECSKLDLGDVQLDTGMLKTTRRGQRKLYSIPEEVVSDLKTYLDHSRELMASLMRWHSLLPSKATACSRPLVGESCGSPRSVLECEFPRFFS